MKGIMEPLAIEIKNLTKSYGETKVLQGINLTVKKGTIFALLGPNGAGKTTLVRILTTLLKPDNGTVYINGINALDDPKSIQKMIGLTGQSISLDERLTGLENLSMIGRLYGLSARETKKRSAELIERFNLAYAANRLVGDYSGGMRRKLDLAMSLIGNPSILFLDEPTTGLDPQSRESLWKELNELVKDGITIILTTQYLEEADRLADN
ncbi:MAG TPA: ATP-binding cassette domain-containing protein, partial [Candidatus Babeliaceae bacterium]|nr:ATP-binding cassette domain-containing protein [Candidatus Babeliaceae bacterium]